MPLSSQPWGDKACLCPGHGASDSRCGFCPLWNLSGNLGTGRVVSGAKWVAGGLLSSRLAWQMVEVPVCSGSFCCPRAKAGLGLAVLQPRRSTRLGHEHWWKPHTAQQVDLSVSAVLLSCFLCLEMAFLSSLRYLGHLPGPKDL